ncbi:hypothetical protein [Paludibaculum fermentans]|uniref:Uncharacterized protein n=1 Tax=Paludibaculum fermentans TaxID=1473598 RepID=A0A7S7SHP1_PALFE|nr:hypothetical protein [Paludibaculum fermentans]QOY86137.1 hypothetical protein IRI77_25450 [Paludibaculum fermentans]
MPSPWKPLSAVVFLCAMSLPQLLAADVPLKVFWRRDSKTTSAESGDPKQPGFLILVPTDKGAKLSVVPGQLRATLMFPKANRRQLDGRPVQVRLVNKNAIISTTHFQIDLTPEDELEIDEYLDTLPEGHRFEPALEIRGFKVGEAPSTAAVIVPTMLDLEIDSKATDTEEDSVVFRAIYLPNELRIHIVEPGLWATKPVVDPPPMKPCQIALNPKTDTLTFHFLNRLNLTNVLQSKEVEDKGLQFEFTPPQAPKTSSEMSSMQSKNRTGDLSSKEKAEYRMLQRLPLERRTTRDDSGRPAAGQPVTKYAAVARPRELPAPAKPYNRRFSYFAPASNREMPLYLSGSFTHSSTAAGKSKDIANFEVSFNPDSKIWNGLNFLHLGSFTSIAPSLYAKMNTNGVVNDENVFRYQLPIRLDYYKPACCQKDDDGLDKIFHLSTLRRISWYTGFLGEATRITNKRTYGGVSEFRFFFSKVKSDDFSYTLQPLLGYEVGRYREQTSNTFTEADATGVIKGADGKPVSEIQLVERRGTFSRLHGSVHSTLTIASKSSLNINYDMFRLLRPESYFDDKASAAGYFTPYKSGTLPATYAAVDTTYSFIAAGRLEKGTRRYLEITYNQEFTKFFDVKFSYTRGELAPAFQFVNKFEVGLALKILGKDSANPR